MDWKIGEIKQVNGEWYQCVEGTGCYQCAFNDEDSACQADSPHCLCRSDKKKVVFKKLEKVGEPYMLEDKKFQKYKVFKTPYIYNKIDCSWQSFADPYYVSLEIKQTKEDMEENKLNLKPFDIQKAKDGKPVCTRDGRKARIICFDKQEGLPIVALVETRVNDRISEEVALFNINGRAVSDDIDSKLDLMMSPEKKEGWVNVYKDSVYDTKDEALIGRSESRGYIDTIKINWSE